MKRNNQQLGEHETKFSLPNIRARTLSSWLTTRCQPDPGYSAGNISSIYFDTKDNIQLNKSSYPDLEKAMDVDSFTRHIFSWVFNGDDDYCQGAGVLDTDNPAAKRYQAHL